VAALLGLPVARCPLAEALALGLGEAEADVEVVGAEDGLAEPVAAEDVLRFAFEADGTVGTLMIPADGVVGCTEGVACGRENGISVSGETGPPSRLQITISE